MPSTSLWRGAGVFRDRQSKGKWMYKFVLNGATYRRRGFATKGDAGEACTKHRLQLQAHPPSAGDSLSVADAITQYLYHHQPPRLAQRTHEKYAHVLGIMAERWGRLPLRDLTRSQVEDYCRWRLSTPVISPLRPDLPYHKGKKYTLRSAGGATVNRDLGALSAMCTWAQGRGWLSEVPCKGLQRFKEPLRQYQPVSPEERKVFAEHLGSEAPKAELLHTLGVRVGVVLTLRWEQVDFGTRIFQYRSKGKDLTRVLGARAIAILESLGPQPQGYVFPTRDASTFRRRWRRACRVLGRHIRPHDLRVTFAREMADAGVDTGTIRDMFGHSTTKMTERYIGSSRAAQLRATQLHDARAGYG